MDILFAAGVVITILLLIALTILRGHLRAGVAPDEPVHLQSPPHRRLSPHPYRAVSVCPVSAGCVEVQSMGARRFLINEAPQLPLPECSADRCTCKYIRHRDRRNAGHDRRISLGTAIYAREGLEDRRSRRGRRKTDWAMA